MAGPLLGNLFHKQDHRKPCLSGPGGVATSRDTCGVVARNFVRPVACNSCAPRPGRTVALLLPGQLFLGQALANRDVADAA